MITNPKKTISEGVQLNNEDIINKRLYKKTEETREILLSAQAVKIDVKEKLIPPQIAWQLYNTKTGDFDILGTLGNFSMVIGKAKSRKSFFISVVVATAVSNNLILKRFMSNLPKDQNEVLYFDTEQGKYHVQLALKRICAQIQIIEPTNLLVYSLRSKTSLERLKMIEALIYNNDRIGFVVIDGIKDLVTSINDEEQASLISAKLLRWSEERNIHIVTVLHQNKSDNNARGHLGTELMNKAETVLSVTKVGKNNDISIVEPQQCRNIEPDTFAFAIKNEMPVQIEDFKIIADVKKKVFDASSLDDARKYKILTEIFSTVDQLGYKDLAEKIKPAYKMEFKGDIGLSYAKQLLTEFKTKGWLKQEKSKAKYSLNPLINSISVQSETFA